MYALRSREIIKVQVESPHRMFSVVDLASLGGTAFSYGESDHATLSPDGREIIVSISEEKSDVWLMESFDPSSPSVHR